ncbi:MAG: recombination mediator RecR [Deltaproteobacteria bacterium]|jgi:recombination protein RecR|nr:recombination mediator RecR [Deltaproteobacteria bacterium]
MRNLPEPLREVMDDLRRLGFGPKAALRAALQLLKWPEGETRRMGEAIGGLRSRLLPCGRCGALTEHDPCAICRDPSRDASFLCVVAEWDSLLNLEQGGFYRGHYLILGGLLSPQDNMRPEQLRLERLEQRLTEGGVAEVILGLGATLEAENTASYLKERLEDKFPALRISRLAQGMPLGAEVKFMDSETLRQSMKYRQAL